MSLVAENIKFKYKGSLTYVLNDFSAEFLSGKICAITGPNGCGKTTLSRLLVGILKPEEGKVSVDGESISELTLAQTGKRIGLVMQDPSKQLFCETVRKEVEYGLRNLILSEEEIANRTSEYLTLFSLENYSNRSPFELSTGEKQRLVLAAIMAMKPSYIILDEPTSSLDIWKRKELAKYIDLMRKQYGTGVVLISHDEAFVDILADSKVELEKI